MGLPLLDTLWAKVERTRRNHGLEHATVTVLLEGSGYSRSLAGRSNSHGFDIVGPVSQEELEQAVAEGLRRMRAGEGSLAVSPFCGTTIAVTGMLAGIFALTAVGKNDRAKSLPNAMVGGMLAVLVGQPLGRMVQRYATTSADVAGLRVVSITRRGWGPFKGYRVETAQ
jgi:hypothetical protein